MRGDDCRVRPIPLCADTAWPATETQHILPALFAPTSFGAMLLRLGSLQRSSNLDDRLTRIKLGIVMLKATIGDQSPKAPSRSWLIANLAPYLFSTWPLVIHSTPQLERSLVWRPFCINNVRIAVPLLTQQVILRVLFHTCRRKSSDA